MLNSITLISSIILPIAIGLSSPITPFMTYNHSVSLQVNVSELWWTVNEDNQTIIFELHIKTTGWIGLGISPAGGMTGADIGVGWVTSNGTVYFQDRHAIGEMLPLIDNTTQDWYALRGQEQNGWTAIQFTRALDTCDSMDVAIKSGTNNLIFAYGSADPSLTPPVTDITYHGSNARGTAILSLRSYSDPPAESKFASMDYFDFQIKNYTIPPDETTYYCQIFRTPTRYTSKRHVVGNKILLNTTDVSIIHHLLMYECDSTTAFNDTDLPADLCDNIWMEVLNCSMNIATGWAVGGDIMTEFPPEAGYPIGANFSIKYYLIQMHYNNPTGCQNCVDNSGLRFYVSDQLRQYDIGYLTFGTDATILSLAIPPQVQNFAVDAYCPSDASSFFPSTGIKVIKAFPHTHLQGKSIWTKIIRNKTAVSYLFNAEAYDFNYQFEHNLPEPVWLYPGDEFSTRCVYNTMNKNTVTVGGESTREEMCLHMFVYYPRMKQTSGCLSRITAGTWNSFLNTSFTSQTQSALSLTPQAQVTLTNYIKSLNWSQELATKWQNFYNNASRLSFFGRSTSLTPVVLSKIPEYKDLPATNCTSSSSSTTTTSSSVSHDMNIFRISFIVCLNILASIS